MLNKTIIFFFFPIFGFAANFDFNCKLTNYKIVGDQRLHSEFVCTGPKEQSFVSAKCLKKCDILEKIKNNDKSEIKFSEIGSPGSNLCHDIGALPYFIVVSSSKSSVEKKICFSPKDHSFVDEEFLITSLKQKDD